uniref:Cytochrome P450 89A2 n=1 Tax=Aegilops tauschii TaxID=37682 RepID=N1R5J0_AEGTA
MEAWLLLPVALLLPFLIVLLAQRVAARNYKDKTTFEHSYVDTLLDIKLPEEEEAGRALTDDEMVVLCSEFLIAGTDTTSTGLQWIMAELVKNPAIQDKLYDEISATTGDDWQEVSEEDIHKMPYLKAVVLEGLRRHPPAHFVLPHKAMEDMEIDGREIRMMPFGVGRRICAGLGVAMLHLEYFVANLVNEFEWREIPGDEVDFAEKPEFTVVMAKPLCARNYRGPGFNKFLPNDQSYHDAFTKVIHAFNAYDHATYT